MKWLNKIWPWSQFIALRAEADDSRAQAESANRRLDFERSIHADHQKWGGRFYSAVRGECSREQLANIQAEVDRIAEAECASVGYAAHADQKHTPLFPPKKSRIMDPNLDGSPAGNGVKLVMGGSLPKLDDLQTDYQRSGVNILDEIHGIKREVGGSTGDKELFNLRDADSAHTYINPEREAQTRAAADDIAKKAAEASGQEKSNK